MSDNRQSLSDLGAALNQQREAAATQSTASADAYLGGELGAVGGVVELGLEGGDLGDVGGDLGLDGRREGGCVVMSHVSVFKSYCG